LTNISGSTGKIRKILPVLDDLLYNTVTWVIPLTVSFAYNDFLAIKIFSLVNMSLHVLCAVYALILHRKISDCVDDKGHSTDDGRSLQIPLYFLLLFPVIVIPIFWIIYITITHVFDSISILFIILFGILLISTLIWFIIWIYVRKGDSVSDYDYLEYILAVLGALMFYTPNILQTLLIVLYWPINFYFVKTCVFILVLSLTRNVSYFTDEVPKDFLATSTTITQWGIQYWFNEIRKSTNEKRKKVEMEKKSKELIELLENDETKKELFETIINGIKEYQGDVTQKEE